MKRPRVDQPVTPAQKAQREYRKRKQDYVKALEQKLEEYRKRDTELVTDLQRRLRMATEENERLKNILLRITASSKGFEPAAPVPQPTTAAGKERPIPAAPIAQTSCSIKHVEESTEEEICCSGLFDCDALAKGEVPAEN
ncbi:hypothetical protein BZG36_04391 [Bifiguratus adelaidae]|uniref:BZIP domain-containing protein n=1 Tax=Bifiguratus adelaidae TaxID=1938954 RepID=A0A261XVQ8_9FUNG|nr:hypothetical protein BZG36_04391 [Bifiguratus adelaidae]